VKKRCRSFSSTRPTGFTLVEMLVSIAILAIIMVLMSSMLTQTQKAYTYNKSKTEEFREARTAYTALTGRLSQATLNTYYDYVDANGNTRAAAEAAGGATAFNFIPVSYTRISELRYISGPGLAATAGGATLYTHSIFFQAPLGFSASPYTAPTGTTTQGMSNLLNTCGYYIGYGPDPRTYPTFATTAPRSRFRLMELIEPTESLSIYTYTSGGVAGTASTGSPNYTDQAWFTNPLGAATTEAHVLADNIIALVLLPKLSPADDPDANNPALAGTLLAPNYSYDTTKTGNVGNSPGTNPGLLDSKNQLPPIVQVSMVAISEDSAKRIAANPAVLAALQGKINGLFTAANGAANLNADLRAAPDGSANSLEQFLITNKISYRIFTSDVSIKAAKWSTSQTN
jgi:uncharacterized protein (TIGR02599 family)